MHKINKKAKERLDQTAKLMYNAKISGNNTEYKSRRDELWLDFYSELKINPDRVEEWDGFTKTFDFCLKKWEGKESFVKYFITTIVNRVKTERARNATMFSKEVRQKSSKSDSDKNKTESDKSDSNTNVKIQRVFPKNNADDENEDYDYLDTARDVNSENRIYACENIELVINTMMFVLSRVSRKDTKTIYRTFFSKSFIILIDGNEEVSCKRVLSYKNQFEQLILYSFVGFVYDREVNEIKDIYICVYNHKNKYDVPNNKLSHSVISEYLIEKHNINSDAHNVSYHFKNYEKEFKIFLNAFDQRI